jgi:hypothetical protein
LYSPRRRTGLLLCGAGTAGAYQAGVLNALAEAGVKIDVVAAHGPGVLNALCAAADGTAVLADGGGPWTRSSLKGAYRWRPAIRMAGAGLLIVLLLLLSPALLLIGAGLIYAASLLASLAGLADTATWLVEQYGATLQVILNPPIMPTLVPRGMVLGLLVVGGVLVAAAVRTAWTERSKRRLRGAFWWRLVGTPIAADEPGATLVDALWRLVRGASGGSRPDPAEMGRRYVELLVENLRQPGFRELLIGVHDLDARRDVVGAVLLPESMTVFTSRRAKPGPREADSLDLSGATSTLVVDFLHGALRLPAATPPQPVVFPAEHFWRGEMHHFCDRPDLALRLLDELVAVGAEQIVLVSAAPPPSGPHSLKPRPLDLRGRVGAFLRSAETAACDTAWARAASVTDRVFLVRPVHNPIGPFDFGGVYDDASDRHRQMTDLVRQGYEDAYQQFIGPVVAGGEGQAAPRS